ncbi:MAG: ABC transporter permease subunit [Bdellovibrionales bacterium]|nr:ABC transporter permease subunit [Bdellovibrionales bacterium]
MTTLLRVLSPLVLIATAQAGPTKELRWAADAKSGVPYMFIDPNDPTKKLGFELDIMTAIATRMGRKLVFVQNEWESLVPGLERGDYDVAANGIEITPERQEQVLFSNPYYSTFEQLIVNADNAHIKSIEDLKGKKAGTLKASLAHYILEKQTKAKIVFYEEEDQGYTDVQNKRIDAFFIDYPIALYYAYPNPKLKAVGDPVGKMFYGVAVSKKHPEIVPELNTAIKTLIESGELAKILAKWNLLHPFTVRELNLKTESVNDTSEFQKVADLKSKTMTFKERMDRYASLMPILLKGAATSIEISVISMFVAIAFGLMLALMRLYGTGPVAMIGQTIVELLRGTPLLIQLYLIFFGLPYLGVSLTPFWAAIMGLGFNYGAYEAENYRAGIEAIPRSQLEAAQALALSPIQRFIHVIFPQAYRIILPPMTNDFISLIKDSSLVSVITMVELTTIYSQLASTYFDHLGLGILVALIYFAIGYPFVRLARRLEYNLKKKTG